MDDVQDLQHSAQPLTTLAPEHWWRMQRDHRARALELTSVWRSARDAGNKHEIEDFLFSYYPVRPGRLTTWNPGAGVALQDDAATPELHADWTRRLGSRWHRQTPDGAVKLDVAAFLADRGSAVKYILNLLRATAQKPANIGCFGLHEWAMVYRQGEETRHVLPLRLGATGTDQVVEAHQIRCTHIDAFRFFTPAAAPLNKLTPTRESQAEFEQPGCLHANMDLYKWAWKLTPAIPGDLLLDCFELSKEIRYLDMQASPYDVSKFGLPAIAIETPEGKAQYSARQKDFAVRSAPLRSRLISLCEDLLE